MANAMSSADQTASVSVTCIPSSVTIVPVVRVDGSSEPAGTMARLKPSRAASASRRRRPTAAHLAGQADLAERDQVGRQGLVVRGALATASATARSTGGLGEPDAADRGGVDVAARAA